MASTSVSSVVLVAEDDPDLRALVEIVLHNAGYSTLPVDSGREALLAAAEHRPDLMVLDVRMPGLDGLEVCRTVRRSPDGASCAILLMSSHASPEEIAEGMAAGADDYLPKPFSPGELLGRVTRLLDTARSA